MPGSSSLALPVANFRREGVPGSSSVVSPYRKFRQAVPDSSFVAFPVASFGRQGVPDSSFGAFLLQIWDGRGAQVFLQNCPSKFAVRKQLLGAAVGPSFLTNLCCPKNFLAK